MLKCHRDLRGDFCPRSSTASGSRGSSDASGEPRRAPVFFSKITLGGSEAPARRRRYLRERGFVHLHGLVQILAADERGGALFAPTKRGALFGVDPSVSGYTARRPKAPAAACDPNHPERPAVWLPLSAVNLPQGRAGPRFPSHARIGFAFVGAVRGIMFETPTGFVGSA